MIYKIIVNIENIIGLLDDISQHYNVFFKNNILYISSIDYKNVDFGDIKKLFNQDNIYIEEINEINLKYEEPDIIVWCRDYFVQRDLKKYEKNHQDEISNYMKTLDRFEQNLELIYQEKVGDNINGRREEKSRET